ncbi:hypothetical protein [Streptomyces sp. NPDC001978]|uniref:hypothetical protein n=1 Tax=Streptomyces sp. NPDC001978 TaxID=3364627 RepID=UPI0036A916BA
MTSPTTAIREELADQLQRHLNRHAISDVERATVVGGHTVDLLFTADRENAALLIDTGPLPGRCPARELRLTHAR